MLRLSDEALSSPTLIVGLGHDESRHSLTGELRRLQGGALASITRMQRWHRAAAAGVDHRASFGNAPESTRRRDGCGNLGDVCSTARRSPGAHDAVYANSFDGFVVRFDADGKRQWLGEEADQRAAVTPTGELYVAGSTHSNAGLATPGAFKAYINTKGDAGFSITSIELTTEADVPGLDADKFLTIAEATKKACPVSKALAGVRTITLKASLRSSQQ